MEAREEATRCLALTGRVQQSSPLRLRKPFTCRTQTTPISAAMTTTHTDTAMLNEATSCEYRTENVTWREHTERRLQDMERLQE